LAALSLALALISGFAAADAGAATPAYPSQLTITDFGVVTATQLGIIGRVGSPKGVCIQGRAIRAVIHYPDGTTKVGDSVKSSGNGYWGLAFNDALVSGADHLYLRMSKAKVAVGGSTVTCLAAAVKVV
jgi:hypothetical protein